uniref:Uncharacterized protein n=1 Tax=Ditylenchus dipsaci TaxID=166011 RepID=A0A915DZ47_9BILA
MSRGNIRFPSNQSNNQRFQAPTGQRPANRNYQSGSQQQYGTRPATTTNNYQQQPNRGQQNFGGNNQQSAYRPSAGAPNNFNGPRNPQQGYAGNGQVRKPNQSPQPVFARRMGKAYRYDVDILNTLRQKSLTKACDDGQRALNRKLCYDILVTAHFKTGGFGMAEGGEVVYDNRCTIYTSTPLNMSKSSVNVENSEVPDFVKRYCKDASFVVTILPNATNQFWT